MALATTLASDKALGDFLHSTGDTITSVGLGDACVGAAVAHLVKRNREKADNALMDELFKESAELGLLPPAWVFEKSSYISETSSSSREIVLADR